jgi:hypothetical protein
LCCMQGMRRLKGNVMKRLYFLTPNLDSTATIADDLKKHGVEDSHIHVMGRDHAGFESAHLHEAGILQSTDFLHAAKTGAAYGGATGLIAGVAALAFPPAGLALGGGTLIGLGLLGAGFGAWASSMIGISIPDAGVEKWQKELDNGQTLMLVDVPVPLELEITGLVRHHHPEAIIDSVEFEPGDKPK